MDLSQIINYGGFVIGVFGIVLSIYLYRKSIEAKDPRCYYLTYQDIVKLDGQGETKIKLLYGNEEVERVFTTYIWLWNAGKKTIQRGDIPTKAPLVIKLIDEKQALKILDYKVIKVSRNAIEFSITKQSEKTLDIQFDFLDRKDGVVIEIQHSGSFMTTISIEGIIQGAQEGFKIKSGEKNISSTSTNAPRPRRFTRANFLEVVESVAETFLRGMGAIAVAGFLGLMGLTALTSPSFYLTISSVFVRQHPSPGDDLTISVLIMSIVACFLVYLGWPKGYPFPNTLHFDNSRDDLLNLQNHDPSSNIPPGL